ncbi:Peptide transporter PTR2 [Yarrowia sp. B02]|nr:Peptide transporter PTR2 [Yarrowia sp. B02]
MDTPSLAQSDSSGVSLLQLAGDFSEQSVMTIGSANDTDTKSTKATDTNTTDTNTTDTNTNTTILATATPATDTRYNSNSRLSVKNTDSFVSVCDLDNYGATDAIATTNTAPNATSATPLLKKPAMTADVLDSEEGEIISLPDLPEDVPHIADKIPYSAYLVAVVELCERFTYYGLSGPFQNYIQNPREGRLPGALGLGQQKAVALLYAFQFWCYLTPVFGAIIADSYWGKYKTILRFAIVNVVGVFVLVVSSLPVNIENGWALPGLLVAMVIIGLGTGGIKANVSPLIGEQYRNEKYRLVYTKGESQAIISPVVTIQSIFMIFYYCINIGCLAPIITSYVEMKVDFWAAYLIPGVFFFFGMAALVVGRNMYYSAPVKGSVVPDAVAVAWLLFKERGNRCDTETSTVSREMAPTESSARDSEESLLSQDLETSPEFVAPADSSISPRAMYVSKTSGNKYTAAFVQDIMVTLKACRVFLFYPVYWLVYGQMTSNFIAQAGQMNTYSIPNDIMSNIDPITLLLFIPIVEKKFYPWLRTRGYSFGPLARIFTGFMCAALAMVWACGVQVFIYRGQADTQLDSVGVENLVSVFWQVPAYILIAFSEILASVTGLEYAFLNAPKPMKSLVMSVFLVTNAGGYAMGIVISPWFKDPYMVTCYFWIAALTFATGAVFRYCFRD